MADKIYMEKMPGYDAYALYILDYHLPNTEHIDCSVLDRVEEEMPLFRRETIRVGDPLKPVLIITGPMFRNLFPRETLEGFIESVCELFGYLPKSYTVRIKVLDRILNKVAEIMRKSHGGGPSVAPREVRPDDTHQTDEDNSTSFSDAGQSDG